MLFIEPLQSVKTWSYTRLDAIPETLYSAKLQAKNEAQLPVMNGIYIFSVDFWVMTISKLVGGYQHFGETCFFRLHDMIETYMVTWQCCIQA
jgi:hypothetical protein